MGFNAEHIRSKTDLHIHVGGYQNDRRTHAHINNMHVHTRLNLFIPHVCPHAYIQLKKKHAPANNKAEREAWIFPLSGSHGGHLCSTHFNSHSKMSLFFFRLCHVTHFPAFPFISFSLFPLHPLTKAAAIFGSEVWLPGGKTDVTSEH